MSSKLLKFGSSEVYIASCLDREISGKTIIVTVCCRNVKSGVADHLPS